MRKHILSLFIFSLIVLSLSVTIYIGFQLQMTAFAFPISGIYYNEQIKAYFFNDIQITQRCATPLNPHIEGFNVDQRGFASWKFISDDTQDAGYYYCTSCVFDGLESLTYLTNMLDPRRESIHSLYINYDNMAMWEYCLKSATGNISCWDKEKQLGPCCNAGIECQNIQVCEGTTVNYNYNTWSSGAGCPSPEVSFSRPDGCTFPVGVANVTGTITISSQKRDTCSFTVKVVPDYAEPEFECPDNITIQATGCLTGVDYPYIRCTDDCDPSPNVIFNPPSDTGFIGGQTTQVTVTCEDQLGKKKECTFSVTVTEGSLQSQINAASDGETIVLEPGTYYENICFKGKAITLRSKNPNDPSIVAATIIDGQEKGPVVSFTSGEGNNSVLNGITVQNGFSTTWVDFSGGGILCHGSSPTISNCVIKDNNEDGGIICKNASPKISKCRISHNYSEGNYGGGIALLNSSPSITNCLIIGNDNMELGGGIYCVGTSSPFISNCTIVSNSNSGIGFYQGDFDHPEVPSATIVNCIIWDNFKCVWDNSNCITSNNSIDITGQVPNVKVSYSDVQGGYEGTKNKNSDPLFINPGSGDYHLQNGSPCKDAGTSDNTPEFDIDGNPRPSGEGYDMGAYEFQQPTSVSMGLVVDFGDNGFGFFKEREWEPYWPGVNVEWLGVYNNIHNINKLVADAGGSGIFKGLLEYNGSEWEKITDYNPDNTGNTMVAWRNSLVVDFGNIGYGYWDGQEWRGWPGVNPEWLGVYGDKLVVDVGYQGLWELWEENGEIKYRQINGKNPDNTGNTMVAWRNSLVVDFGNAGYGYWDGQEWRGWPGKDPEWLGVYGDKLVVDVGYQGLWELWEENGEIKYRQISGENPDNTGNTMVAWRNGLVVDFGDKGVRYYDGNQWAWERPINVEWLHTYGDKLVADQGSSGDPNNYGTWEFDANDWTKIKSFDPDNSGNTMVSYSFDHLEYAELPIEPSDSDPNFELCFLCGEITVVMNIPEGWGMISLPVEPLDARASVLFSGAEVVYGYEKRTGYTRVTSGEELQVGEGYWILLDQNQTYNLTGQPIESYMLPVSEGGWAMIGGCSSDAKTFSDNFSIGVIYGYEKVSGYKRVLESENLEPGKGYWILFENITDQASLTVQGIMQ